MTAKLRLVLVLSPDRHGLKTHIEASDGCFVAANNGRDR